MSESATHFVVYRLNWASTKRYPEERTVLQRLPGRTRIQAFDDPDEAWEQQQQWESEARKQFNPFACGRLFAYLTHLDEDRLHDWLLDHDLEPPKVEDGQRDWYAWWDDHVDEWSDDQKTLIWNALGKVRFYEIAEEPRREIVFVIQKLGWTYNDEGYDSSVEGGTPIKAYRSRARAEEALREMEPGVLSNSEEEPYDRRYRAQRYRLLGQLDGSCADVPPEAASPLYAIVAPDLEAPTS